MEKTLVVDDDAFSLKLAITVQQQAGYEVFSADHAEAGVALALKDIQMPAMPGMSGAVDDGGGRNAYEQDSDH